MLFSLTAQYFRWKMMKYDMFGPTKYVIKVSFICINHIVATDINNYCRIHFVFSAWLQSQPGSIRHLRTPPQPKTDQIRQKETMSSILYCCCPFLFKSVTDRCLVALCKFHSMWSHFLVFASPLRTAIIFLYIENNGHFACVYTSISL